MATAAAWWQQWKLGNASSVDGNVVAVAVTGAGWQYGSGVGSAVVAIA